jgi:glycosyltransferase involved in cell wall biosynthesis
MVFAIITHVPHGQTDSQYFAYSPYVREMNIWTKFVDEVIIVAPLEALNPSAIHLAYDHSKIHFTPIPAIDLLRVKAMVKAIFETPRIAFQIYKTMKKADHIHLRCPGNIGLIACFVQILFPKKIKTAKYAGNWDPNSKQPWSYRWQRWLLSNTFLTKNMQVLVYGEWEKSSKNIKPFFTASYKETDKIAVEARSLNQEISALFVGTFTSGKRPLYAIQLIEALRKKGISITLSLYGNGNELEHLNQYIQNNNLKDFIFIKGNQTQEVVKQAYQKSHFVVLPSASEGWPKVVAEGMFWGCLPIATKVSCVPNMLGNGSSGVLLSMHINDDAKAILDLIQNPSLYFDKVQKSILWSRKYTLDLFEIEIKALLNS